MSEPKKPNLDPNEVVETEDGDEVRPGRFISDGSGMSVEGDEDTEDGEE